MFDLEDLKRRTDELADFVVAAAAQYQFAAEKVVAVGYSNGANIAASILLRRPGTLPTAVLLRAMVPLVPEKLPDLSAVRVWIGGGKQDVIIAPSETQRLVELLRAAGAEVTARFFEAGHGLTNTDSFWKNAGFTFFGNYPIGSVVETPCSAGSQNRQAEALPRRALSCRLVGGLSATSSSAARSHFPRSEAAS